MYATNYFGRRDRFGRRLDDDDEIPLTLIPYNPRESGPAVSQSAPPAQGDSGDGLTDLLYGGVLGSLLPGVRMSPLVGGGLLGIGLRRLLR